MRIITYFHRSKEDLYNDGKKAGLTGDALNFFTYLNEVKIELEVDPKTGGAVLVKLNDDVVMRP